MCRKNYVSWFFLVWLLGICLSSPLSQAAEPEAPTNKFSFGTGFFVSTTGYIVTARHVVKDRLELRVRVNGEQKLRPVTIIKDDAANDLALLQVQGITGTPLAIADWQDVPIGLESYVIGFPQPGVQGLSLKFTGGLVNGVVKTKQGIERFQISAEVHKGNSGGPVLGPDGSVIGVIQAKMDALKVAEKTHDLPQNVNYALKSDELIRFLANTPAAVEPKKLDPKKLMRPYEIARQAAPAIVVIVGKNNPEAEVALTPQ